MIEKYLLFGNYIKTQPNEIYSYENNNGKQIGSISIIHIYVITTSRVKYLYNIMKWNK
jgi:hypothetical protein